jgi:formiminotetrahydrofolate cyclodeaminase
MEMKRFLEKLSSTTPTPGGGSTSALAGALSASLVSMVAGLSSKQKEMEGMRKRALTIQKRLFKAIDEDAKSFDGVMKAFRFPKNTERERLYRSKMIQKAYQKAIVTPRWVCHYSIQLLDYCRILILKGNPNAVSDAGVAAFLADTALKGGLLNIGINLGSVSDRSFVKKMRLLVRKLEKRRNQFMKRIQKTLNATLPI